METTYAELREEVHAIAELRATLAERLEASGQSGDVPLPPAVADILRTIKLGIMVQREAGWNCLLSVPPGEPAEATCSQLKAHLDRTERILTALGPLLDKEGTPTPEEQQAIDACVSDGEGGAGATDLWLSLWQPSSPRA